MRNLFLLLLISASSIWARDSYSQKSQEIFNVKSGTIESIFRQIKKQSHYEFFYNTAILDVKESVSLTSPNGTLEEILGQVLGNKYNYSIRDNYILISERIPCGRGFGICEACEEGNTLYNMNGDVLFSEVAAVEVSSFNGLPDQFIPKIIKGGRYAVFTHTGSLSLLQDSYSYIWGTWFLGTNEKLDAREDFELYDQRFLGYDHPESQIDLYIPIR